MPDRVKRIKTVEHEPGEGWIARNPWTGQEILETGWRWNSRAVARTVVAECRLFREKFEVRHG